MILQILIGLAAFCLSSASLRATEPRAKPTDYPANASSDALSIGAEYLVHSFSDGHQTFFVPNYLVVDTAVYPHGTLLINEGNFRLRMNGSILLPVQAPNMVAYSLQNSGFANPESDGTPGSGPHFPGDRRPPEPRPDTDGTNPFGDRQPAHVVAIRGALPEGEFHSPQGGFLYFLFEGKTKKIKSLDLLYNGPAGELVIKLF